MFCPSSAFFWLLRRAVGRRALLALPLLAACQRGAVPTAAGPPPLPAPARAEAAAPVASLSPRVQQLLTQMTLEEKIGQMTQLNISAINITGVQKDVVLDSAKTTALVRNFHVGSFLNGEAVPAAQWVRYSAALQRIALRESRLQIPMIYGIDHMHGASYVAGTAIFPHNLNLGAGFNPEVGDPALRAQAVAAGAAAIIWAGLPGYGGGPALAEIISGKTNPSGRLPFTYPQFAGHITNYHHDNNENKLDLSDFGAGFEQRGAKYTSSMLTEFGQG